MNLKTFKAIALAATLAAAGLAGVAAPGAAFAQAKEQFFPLLAYRTGAYAPERHALGQRQARLPEDDQRPRRRHQRRQARPTRNASSATRPTAASSATNG